MLELNVYATLVIASLVLLAGRKLVNGFRVLQTYSIPEPVAGGLLVAIMLYALYATSGNQIRFDNTLSAPLMLTFFSCIGLNADLASLKQGGKRMVVFLGVVAGFLIMQNRLGLLIARSMGLNPLIGLLAGSISLSGGHGTGAAWGKVFSERYGFPSASEIALACATFGLVLGGLIGGPLANRLSRMVSLPTRSDDGNQLSVFEEPGSVRLITAPAMIETLALIAVCLMGGQLVSDALSGTFLELPTFVCSLFVGVLLRNILGAIGFYQVFERAVSVLGNVALSLFLANALMSLRLWELASLALPMLVLLTCQTALMALYARFVTFPMMGSTYDAAVIAAGHCGFGLGATPTAVANMQAVTERFGPSHVAFLVVPMVGAFFIDIANATVIKLFLILPFFSN